MIHYPIPPHKQAAYRELNENVLPVTEMIHEQVLSLPFSQVIRDEELNLVIRTLNTFPPEKNG